MALTRAFLKGMGLTEEQVSAIVEAHAETMGTLKEQRDTYKNDAEKLADVQKELDALKNAGASDDGWQEKYEAEHAAFEKYKDAQKAEKAKAEKVGLYTAMLKEVGIAENRIDAIIKITDLNEYKVKDGAFTDADKIKEAVKNEWKDFIVQQNVQGAQTQTPPGNAGGQTMTKEEIYKMDDKGRFVLSAEERQAALAQLRSSNT